MARRTNAEIELIKRSIYDLCQAYQPMTVRQLFYALTTEGVIDKTEQEYKNTVCRLTKLMRLSGELPWHWLADNTRWMHKPRTYYPKNQRKLGIRPVIKLCEQILWNAREVINGKTDHLLLNP